MRYIAYITGVVLTLSGLAALLGGASDLFSALLLCCGCLASTLGAVYLSHSRRPIVGELLIDGFFIAYLVYAAASTSRPLPAFHALRSPWLCGPMMIGIAAYGTAVVLHSRKEANQALLPTPTAVTPAASHPPRQP